MLIIKAIRVLDKVLMSSDTVIAVAFNYGVCLELSIKKFVAHSNFFLLLGDLHNLCY